MTQSPNTGVLEAGEVEVALAGLDGWSLNEDGAITKRFKFPDFVAAFGFMTKVAILAEKAGHHPDWSNSYNSVTIALMTHDKKGLTEKDLRLAEKIQAL